MRRCLWKTSTVVADFDLLAPERVRNAVVVRPLDVGFVQARTPHRRLLVVGDHEFRHPAPVLEHPHVRRFVDLAGPPVRDLDRRARAVHERLLARPVDLPQHHIESPAPLPVAVAETGRIGTRPGTPRYSSGARSWSGVSRTCWRREDSAAVHVGGREEIRKRILIQAAAFNLGLLMAQYVRDRHPARPSGPRRDARSPRSAPLGRHRARSRARSPPYRPSEREFRPCNRRDPPWPHSPPGASISPLFHGLLGRL